MKKSYTEKEHRLLEAIVFDDYDYIKSEMTRVWNEEFYDDQYGNDLITNAMISLNIIGITKNDIIIKSK